MVLVRPGTLGRIGERNVPGSFKEASGRAWEIADEAEQPALAELSRPHVGM